VSLRARRIVERAVIVLAVTAGYYGLALVGSLNSLPPSSFAIIWPATAYLVGVLLLTPPSAWWAYPLGLVPAHFHLVSHIAQLHVPPEVAATQIVGNMLLAAATALAVRRAGRGEARLDSFRGALAFILIAGLLVPAAVNALILTVHRMTGWTHQFWQAWGQWMLASIFPAVTVTPVMVLAADRSGPLGVARHRAETALLCLLQFGLTFLAFGGRSGAEFQSTLLLAPLPILLWTAARCGAGCVCLSLLSLATAMVVRALQGVGPFSAEAPADEVASMQVYLTAISVPFILLGALVQERRRDEDRLRRSEARMAIAAASTDTGFWQWDAVARGLWMTEHCRSMFRLRDDAALTPDDFLPWVHSDDRPGVQAALHDALAAVDVTALAPFRVRRGRNEERLFVLRTHADRDAAGKIVCVSGQFRDITEMLTAQREAEDLTRRLLVFQEEERKNISEALHDSTTQHLVGAGLLLNMLDRRLKGSPAARALVEDLRAMITEAVNELRAFSYLLRPPELEREGLCAVLRRYVRGFGFRTGIQAKARIGPDADLLPLEHQRALLRVAQEGLANVYRHAAATHVTVDLRRLGHDLHLVVRDDGRGMPGAARRAHEESPRLGVGIPGMTARIRQLGGRFDVRSGRTGTRVHVVLPIVQRAGRQAETEPERELIA
jgi:signal transduction histidine kinase